MCVEIETRAPVAQHDTRRSDGLQRLFSAFPGGSPGLGLLLLRAAVGVTAVVEGSVHLAQYPDPSPATWMIVLPAVAGGILLLIGYLTPVAGVLTGVGVAAIALPWTALPTQGLLDGRWGAILVMLMALAVALTGPGALSLDCHLFGRREIVIPHDARHG